MRASNCAHKCRAGCPARVAPKSVRTVFNRSACGSRGSLWDRESHGATVHHTSGAACRRLGAYPDFRRTDNPLYHYIIATLNELSRYPNIINMRFDVRSEPVGCTPEVAHRCYVKTGMDVLVLETNVVSKGTEGAVRTSEQSAEAVAGKHPS